jgi:hypothetical protein
MFAIVLVVRHRLLSWLLSSQMLLFFTLQLVRNFAV